MAKKLKETYIHTYRHTDRLPLVVLSAAVAAKKRMKKRRKGGNGRKGLEGEWVGKTKRM